MACFRLKCVDGLPDLTVVIGSDRTKNFCLPPCPGLAGWLTTGLADGVTDRKADGQGTQQPRLRLPMPPPRRTLVWHRQAPAFGTSGVAGGVRSQPAGWSAGALLKVRRGQ